MNFLTRDGLVLHTQIQTELSGILEAVRINLVAMSLWRVRFLVVWRAITLSIWVIATELWIK